VELELSRMAELAAERVQDWDPYACPGGGEFFPMSPKVFEESVGFYRNTRRRMWREDHIREHCALEQNIPESVFSRTVQREGTTSIWDPPDGPRLRWWGEICSGARIVKYTLYGPGGTAGLWVGPLLGRVGR